MNVINTSLREFISWFYACSGLPAPELVVTRRHRTGQAVVHRAGGRLEEAAIPGGEASPVPLGEFLDSQEYAMCPCVATPVGECAGAFFNGLTRLLTAFGSFQWLRSGPAPLEHYPMIRRAAMRFARYHLPEVPPEGSPEGLVLAWKRLAADWDLLIEEHPLDRAALYEEALRHAAAVLVVEHVRVRAFQSFLFHQAAAVCGIVRSWADDPSSTGSADDLMRRIRESPEPALTTIHDVDGLEAMAADCAATLSSLSARNAPTVCRAAMHSIGMDPLRSGIDVRRVIAWASITATGRVATLAELPETAADWLATTEPPLYRVRDAREELRLKKDCLVPPGGLSEDQWSIALTLWEDSLEQSGDVPYGEVRAAVRAASML